MKPEAFNYAEFKKLQADYEKQKEINKEWADDYEKLLAKNRQLQKQLDTAVEVVRCGKCRFCFEKDYISNSAQCRCPDRDIFSAEESFEAVYLTDFCSYGERRESEVSE